MEAIFTNAIRTGIHIIAATFLLPLGVAAYTFVGGIKATSVLFSSSSLTFHLNSTLISFLTDYFHTFTILIICCYFTIKAFTVEEIGSPGHLFELVQAA